MEDEGIKIGTQTQEYESFSRQEYKTVLANGSSGSACFC